MKDECTNSNKDSACSGLHLPTWHRGLTQGPLRRTRAASMLLHFFQSISCLEAGNRSGRTPPSHHCHCSALGVYIEGLRRVGRKAGLGKLNPSTWEFKEALQFIMWRARRIIKHLLTEGVGLKLCGTTEPAVSPRLTRSGASKKAGSEHSSVTWKSQQGFVSYLDTFTLQYFLGILSAIIHAMPLLPYWIIESSEDTWLNSFWTSDTQHAFQDW